MEFYLLQFGITLMFLNRWCNGVYNKVEQGVIRGKTEMTKTGFSYESYQGIPYAKPPIGDLRFRDPLPIEKWVGALNATSPPNACPQFDLLFTGNHYGTEDCLYLNVYVPKSTVRIFPWPVMVWLHGGGFILGDSSSVLYGPDYFVENGVILVTVNYRLGPFGFLSLDTPDIPGNAGLKDQNLALKWVNKNICKFGGQANKVTIFGESSGAVSAQYHTLSPMSRGLFGGVIMQSGSSLNPWGWQPHPVKIAHKIAKILGMHSETTDVAKFLRNVSVNNLLFASTSPSLVTIGLPYAPSVEKVFENVTPFLTKPPEEILKSGQYTKVPTMCGLNTYDGLVYKTAAFSSKSDLEAIKNHQAPNLKAFVPEELKEKYGDKTEKIEAKIREFYFPKVAGLSENLTNLYTDFMFARGIISSANYLKRNCLVPTFFYKFSYSGTRNLMRHISDLKYKGAAHLDEIPYMFDVKLNNINEITPSVSDMFVSIQILQMWTNFAKYRNPTPLITPYVPLIWLPVSPTMEDLITLDIDDVLTIGPNPFMDRVKFWDDLIHHFLKK